MNRVLVVFTDNRKPEAGDGFGSRLLYRGLKLLRPGFRHCFVVIPDATGLTVLDPRSDFLRIERLAGHGYLDDLAFMRKCGQLHLVTAARQPDDGRLRLGAITCVSFVVRLLRLDPRYIFGTPAMLFRHLQQMEMRHGGQSQNAGAGR